MPHRPRAAHISPTTPSPTGGGRWIATPDPRADSRLRLFCLPYAGGGASLYAGWKGAFPAGVEVLPIQLPGRESRFSETPIDRLDDLVGRLADALGPLLDRPYALFGYSMGALIAHRVAVALRGGGAPEPRRLFVAAHRAPQVPRPGPDLHTMASAAFWQRLGTYNGTPPAVLANAELRSLLEPILRADFALVETCPPPPPVRLDCAVTAIGGAADPMVGPEALAGWRETTAGAFESVQLPGGHFFISTHADLLIRTVASRLAADLPP